jgi:hypothetical protein
MAQQLKHLITPALSKKFSQDWKLHLICNWATIMGNLHDKVCLEKVLNDTLILGVYDACWTQELYLLSSLIIDTINQSLDQPRIKHLRFIRVPPYASVTTKATPLATTAVNVPPTLTSEHKAALQRISDDELRNALLRFLTRCTQGE